MEDGFHSKEERLNKPVDWKPVKRISERERLETPIEFRNLLISMICPTSVRPEILTTTTISN
jgi:hypothetical protein